MEAFKDAIMAYSVYYPVVEILSSVAIACIIWWGGHGVMQHLTAASVAVSFSWKNLFTFQVAEKP